MQTLSDVKPGDTLVIVDSGYRQRRIEERAVTKVGRTLVYVEQYGRPWAFYIAGGSERRGENAGGCGANAYTPDEWAARLVHEAACARFRALGLGEYGSGSYSNLPASVLDAISEIVEAHRAVLSPEETAQ